MISRMTGHLPDQNDLQMTGHLPVETVVQAPHFLRVAGSLAFTGWGLKLAGAGLHVHVHIC